VLDTSTAAVEHKREREEEPPIGDDQVYSSPEGMKFESEKKEGTLGLEQVRSDLRREMEGENDEVRESERMEG